MHFVRMVLHPNLNSWDKDKKADVDLAEEFFEEPFREKDEHPSLYSVESLPDEIRVAAAFALTPTRNPDTLFVVRLFQDDFDALGLNLSDPPGMTGVVEVDFRHFEVRNLTKPKALQLTARLRKSAYDGEDRFRYVAGWLQRHYLQQFRQLPDTQVIAEAKRRCEAKLARVTPPKTTSGKNHHRARRQ
jgi:hypothetical protein